jgi:hypothetical protein
MYWFNYPRRLAQLGGDTPGAPFMQRESLGANAPVGGGGSSAVASAPVVPHSLDFKVRYTLSEYTVFMWQHSGYLIRRRHVSGFSAWWMTAKSTWGAAFNFFLQRRSRHLYEFTIDEHGIVRTNGTGVTLVPWRDVIAIRRYRLGYMMVLERGTLPIPYRCLDDAQRRTMDGFAANLVEIRVDDRPPL